MADSPKLTGPDLSLGIPVADVPDGGSVVGHAGGEAVLLARDGDTVFAIGATCTHYGGPLGDGLVVDGTVRCPWHHACFSLRTGEAIRAPALNPVACFDVERRGERVVVLGKKSAAPERPALTGAQPARIVIVGAGAAGNAAAETLRREGYSGELTLVGAEESVPYDRPNLSKDYLAGNAQEEWIPLRDAAFYAERGIALALGRRATKLDLAGRRVVLDGGAELSFDALLVATGADPVRLALPGADLPHVYLLRTLADSRALIAAAKVARRVVVIGASFIGLEVAASLRTRGLEVHVVGPEAVPLERVLGRELGGLVRRLHEEHGVAFHLGTTPKAVTGNAVELSDGTRLDADLVVMGVGVRPSVALAESAGLAMDRGVSVNEHLETSAPGVWAAGDIARWPDPHSGEKVRVEHWVVAERMGQTAARNMLGRREKFDAVPFFWSQHYDVAISYVGHAEKWDRADVDGSLEERDCRVTFVRGGRTLAVATVGRDRQSLEAERGLEENPTAEGHR